MIEVVTLANKVAELLKDYGAEVMFAPSFELRYMQKRSVAVLPFGISKKLVSRVAITHDYTLNVALIDKCRDDAEVAELIKIISDIGNILLKCKIDSTTCVAVEWDPLYSVDDLRSKKLFISVIKVTFKDVGV